MAYADAVEQIIAAIRLEDRRPLLLGIDGKSGAGKSKLGRELVHALGDQAVLVEGDDFYRDMPDIERAGLSAEEGYKRYFDWERLRAQVLVPVRQGADRIRYQRYDWGQGRLGGWVERRVAGIAVVEGVYTLRRELRDVVDLAIYVQTDADTRRERIVARAQDSAEWIRRWTAAEDVYGTREAPERAALIVVAGT